MSTKERPVFKGKDKEGNELELVIRAPIIKDIRESLNEYNRAFFGAVNSGAFLRVRLNDFAQKQGIWSDEKEAKYTQLRQDILDHERRIDMGGFKLSEARNVAIKMIKLRGELQDLISERTQLEGKTAEGQAENAKFNYLVSVCLVYKSDENRPYYANLEDYINRGSEDAALWGAERLSELLYGLDNNYREKLPEFKFLKEFGFVDDKLRLIRKDGKLIDEDGRLVNETGRFVDEDGKFVDKEGRPVDTEGNYIVDKKPFLDDDGNEIAVAAKVDETPVAVEAEASPDEGKRKKK